MSIFLLFIYSYQGYIFDFQSTIKTVAKNFFNSVKLICISIMLQIIHTKYKIHSVMQRVKKSDQQERTYFALTSEEYLVSPTSSSSPGRHQSAVMSVFFQTWALLFGLGITCTNHSKHVNILTPLLCAWLHIGHGQKGPFYEICTFQIAVLCTGPPKQITNLTMLLEPLGVD